MHEIWLQKYIRENFQQIGFSQIHGPYKVGADFKGVYAGKSVKIEAEWTYSDYITHSHPPGFADILVVATPGPVPEDLKVKLPSIIINLDRERVYRWAVPRNIKKNQEDYYAYPWRRLSRSLLVLYAHYQQLDQQQIDFPGSNLAFSVSKTPLPEGFQFGAGGKEQSYTGPPEDKVYWDYWLIIAHAVAHQFRLKPALLRPTWIDRIALYYSHTGKITDGESERLKEVALFIDEVLSRGEP